MRELRWKLEALSPSPDALRGWINVFDPDTGMPVRLPEPRFLRFEPENTPPITGMPVTGPLANPVAAKKYDVYWVSEPGAHLEIHNGIGVVIQPTAQDRRELSRVLVAKASHHGLTHIPPTGSDPDTWVAEAVAPLLARQAGITPIEPSWYTDPAISLVAATRPRIANTHHAWPYSKLAVWNPMLGNGRAITRWHPTLDPYAADWEDDQGVGGRVAIRPADLAAPSPSALIGDTYQTAVARTRRSIEHTALGPDDRPCGSRTRGVLRPAPTQATGIAIIGKESRRWRDGRNLIGEPEHTTYIKADDWPLLRARLERLAERIGQRALAKAIGIGERTLRYLIAGRSPSAATQAKVIRLLGQNL